MRCRQCGHPWRQTGAESTPISDGVYQTTRYYICTKCGAKHEVTDEPHKVKWCFVYSAQNTKDSTINVDKTKIFGISRKSWNAHITNTTRSVKPNESLWFHLHYTLHSLSNHINDCIYQREVELKMKSGVNIDCKYIIRVSKLMEMAKLPRPKKRLLDIDGTRLPLITVECETWTSTS